VRRLLGSLRWLVLSVVALALVSILSLGPGTSTANAEQYYNLHGYYGYTNANYTYYSYYRYAGYGMNYYYRYTPYGHYHIY
jgi:hypothetical protein